MKKITVLPFVFLLACASIFGQNEQKPTLFAVSRNLQVEPEKDKKSAPEPNEYDNYGGKLGIGISISDAFGVPVRYYFSPKRVVEFGLYSGGVAIFEENLATNETEFYYESGFMAGAGFTMFGNRFLKQKKRKNKVRAHGAAVRLNHLFGDYKTTFASLGWAMETFRENRTHKSFIFELGLQGSFPDFTYRGLEYSDPRPGIYLRCHWNFFVD